MATLALAPTLYDAEESLTALLDTAELVTPDQEQAFLDKRDRIYPPPAPTRRRIALTALCRGPSCYPVEVPSQFLRQRCRIGAALAREVRASRPNRGDRQGHSSGPTHRTAQAARVGAERRDQDPQANAAKCMTGFLRLGDCGSADCCGL